MVIVLTCTGTISFNVLAGTEETKERMEKAREEKEEKEKELSDARGRLENTRNGLAQLEDVKNTYEGQLNILNGELQAVADNLNVIETELSIKKLELEETTVQLEEAVITCENQYAAMKARIRFLYENGDYTYLSILSSANSFGQFLNYADFINDMSRYDRKKLDEYAATQALIAEKKAETEKELAEIEALEAEAVEEKNKVSGLISATSESLAETADDIDSLTDAKNAYEEECDRKKAEADAAASEYAQIKAQYEEELRLSELAKKSSWRDISEVQFDEGDRYLLANLIYCEAGGEPYEGKVGVGAVVINRVLSSRYPDTVTGVIYQNKQFSPVLDGHLALALASDKASAECYSAADAAMSGTTTVGNCLYFRTPIEGLTGLQIGGHIFY